MAVEIKELFPLTDKKDRRDFIQVSFDINKDLSFWVAPLRLSVEEILDIKHPFHKTSEMRFWVARKDGKNIGRIASIFNNTHNEFHHEKIGFWGFLELSIDEGSQEVLEKLLNYAEKAVKKKGATSISGPMNPSTNHECGLLVEGFDDYPQLMMSYNSQKLPAMVEQAGYKKEKDLLAYKLPTRYTVPDIIERISARLEKSERITYRRLNKKDWNNEVERLFGIYNQAWEKNWGFIPFTKEEFVAMAEGLKMIANEKFILFAEVDHIPVGFIICLPDYNQIFKTIKNGRLLPTGIFKLLFNKSSINRVRVITLGVTPKYRRSGIETLLYKKITEEVQKCPQYTEAELSWILEDNLEMNKPLQRMGAEMYKVYRIYQKDLMNV